MTTLVDFLMDALCGFGAMMLPVAIMLLFEEFIFAGLVQLLFAPQRVASQRKERFTRLR